MGNQLSHKKDIDFEAEICFDQFKILRAVGRGAFGKVSIVKKRDTKELFAVKYMNKQKCIDENAVDNVLKERKILQVLYHPLIVNLWYAFQDAEDMFMIVDLMLGGDLRYHLHRYGPYTCSRIKCYAAELCCALEYIHSNGIIHRDIKPDNILMDSNGHVHLADFNVATFIKKSGRKATSRAGTRHYMAPEMVSKQGYDFGCDWWSLGITLYELLTDKNPVYQRNATADESTVNICTMEIEYPKEQMDQPTISFLQGLLNRDPSKRIGTPDRMDEIKNHELIKSIGQEWEEIEQKNIVMEYIPADNKVHCDATYELEELMLEDNPLHKKKKRLAKLGDIDEANVKPGSNDEKMLQIRKNFHIFNREAEVRKGDHIEIDSTEKAKMEKQENIVEADKKLEGTDDEEDQVKDGDEAVMQAKSRTDKLKLEADLEKQSKNNLMGTSTDTLGSIIYDDNEIHDKQVRARTTNNDDDNDNDNKNKTEETKTVPKTEGSEEKKDEDEKKQQEPQQPDPENK